MSAIAGHRGGARLWPENSRLAFREALALGCDLVELDVHLTADGVPAVVHDATLDRTTDGRGPVRARAAADLRRVRLRGPGGALSEERLPMLDEALAVVAAARGSVLVEVKGPGPGVGVRYARGRVTPGLRYDGLEEAVLEAITRAGLVERANVMAFNPEVLVRVRALHPRLRTTLLVTAAHVRAAAARAVDTIDWARRYGATDVGLEHRLVDRGLIDAARAAAVGTGVWTVNAERDMRRLLALGVDVLTTDRPDLAVRLAR